MRWAGHKSYTCLHTYIRRCCCTLCYCSTTPSLLGRDGSARTYVCACVLLGFTCLACVGPAMRATQAYIRTNDVAAHYATVAQHQRYSCAMSPHKTASGTPCTMCTPSKTGLVSPVSVQKLPVRVKGRSNTSPFNLTVESGQQGCIFNHLWKTSRT